MHACRGLHAHTFLPLDTYACMQGIACAHRLALAEEREGGKRVRGG